MQFSPSEIVNIIILATCVFLIAPVFLLIYIKEYLRKKRVHEEEKITLNQKFEAEVLKTRIEVQEQTMQTIAADLHDNIGQLLSLTALNLNSINIEHTEKAKQKINNSIELVNDSIRELRALAKLMQAENILMMGLGSALQQEFNHIEKTGRYLLTIHNQLLEINFASPKKDLILLRLVQEVFNNIIKHSNANHITVNIQLIENHLDITITDDGIGFDVNRTGYNGLGLSSIRKRVEMVQGTLNINSTINQGTSIHIKLLYP
ncbi:sensor histidine kinase [Pedobacter sp.]|uniref:sensor histidine kinase n=1 Tax=Pedobacter sp. TaxID=1411316 RepID=UPI00396CA4BD